MSKMFVPRSIKRLRFERESPNKNNVEKSLDYLVKVLDRVVVSERHIFDANLCVLDVNPETDKLKLKMALESVMEGNKVVKITSSVRKPVKRVFRGSIGKTSAYKRVYVRFSSSFDSSLLMGGDA